MNEIERLKAACDLLMQEVVRLQYAILNEKLDRKAEVKALRAEIVELNKQLEAAKPPPA